MSGRLTGRRRRRDLSDSFFTEQASNRRRVVVAPWNRPEFLATLPPRGDPRRWPLIQQNILANQHWIGHQPGEPSPTPGSTSAFSEFRPITPEPDIEFIDPDDPTESDPEFVNWNDVSTTPRGPTRALTPAAPSPPPPSTPPPIVTGKL